MPNNPRQAKKRKLEQAHRALDNAMQYILEVADEYRPGYKEFFEPLDQVNEMLLTLQALVNDVRKMV